MSRTAYGRPKFHEWPEDAGRMEPANVIKMYEQGFIGASDNPEEWEALKDQMEIKTGSEVAHTYGFADSFAGKLVIPFIHVLELWPGCWPGPAQERGDCVSHSDKNAKLQTIAGDITSGLPDEKTGKVEGAPEVPADGIKNGVFSTEISYWMRGYNGDGWHCPTAAKVSSTSMGAVIRQAYPEAGIDLTRYSGSLAGKYGATRPPANILAIGSQHLIHKITDCSGQPEAIRDLMGNRHGISTCGGEGYSNKRDQYGVSKRSGSWAHAMYYGGFDDRDVIKQIFGEPLLLDLNSWNIWNSGPRDIYQSASHVPPEKKQEWIAKGIVNPDTGNIMIPEGSFWTPWSHCKNREFLAYAGGVGWARKPLPDYGSFVLG